MKFQILKENNNTKYSTMHKMNINSVENRFKLLELEDQNMVYINSQNNNNEYSFVYNIIQLPEIYSQTKLILLSPRYIVANKSPYSLEIKLYTKSQPEITIIDSYKYRHLISNLEYNKNFLSLRIAKNDFIWSPKIPIHKDGSYSIRLKNHTNTNNQIIEINVHISIFII